MGFQETVHKILTILKDKISISHIQKILVSAHFNSKVSSLLEELEMNEPNFVGFENIDSNMKLERLKESKDVEINTSNKLKQQYVLMSEEEKIPILLAYLGLLKSCKVLIFFSTIDEV
jgi:superfamily II DNA/RNA helicase